MISLCLAVQAQNFEKITSMCDGLCDELNDFRKQLEVETTEPDCQQFLLFTLSGVKSYKPHKTGMVDGEHIGENDDSDEANDPQYEIFFESLNKYEKSYLLEGKIIDVSVCVKYEGDSKFGGKRKPKCARKNHKKKCARKMSRDDGRVDGAAEQSPRLPNEQAPVNQHASDNVNDRKNEISKDKPLYPKPSSEKNMEEHQHEDADLTQPCKKHKVQRQRKLRKVVRGSHEIKVDDAASRNDVAQTKNKLLFHKPCSSKNQVKKNCNDQPRPKQSHSMFMKERDITDGSDSDVEILDNASFYRAGNPGPFVSSKKFHKSVMEDDNIKLPEWTSPQFEFRRQVMNVLQKPYDKQESNRLREAFMAGSYVKFHPDLVKKLAAHRYKKGKCLTILRGFFFWLENLTKQGSFKPWEDSECLGVDPALL